MRLCVLHNLYFYNKLMEDIRTAIENNEFINLRIKWLNNLVKGLELIRHKFFFIRRVVLMTGDVKGFIISIVIMMAMFYLFNFRS